MNPRLVTGSARRALLLVAAAILNTAAMRSTAPKGMSNCPYDLVAACGSGVLCDHVESDFIDDMIAYEPTASSYQGEACDNGGTGAVTSISNSNAFWVFDWGQNCNYSTYGGAAHMWGSQAIVVDFYDSYSTRLSSM